MWYRKSQNINTQNTQQTYYDWDSKVRLTNEVGVPKDKKVIDNDVSEGPGVLGTENRRLSPYHNNPEETPWEEQLETVRQQNVNKDPMANLPQQPPNNLSPINFKGPSGSIPKYNEGKNWQGFSNQTSTQTFAQ